MIEPYVKSTQIYNCPSDTLDQPTNSNRTYVFRNWTRWGSYAMPLAYWGSDGANEPTTGFQPSDQPRSLSQIEAVSTTLWATDTAADNSQQFPVISWDNMTDQPVAFNNRTPPRLARPGDDRTFVARHLDTMNVLFVDGHVKAMRVDALAKTNAKGVLPFFTLEDD